MYTGLAQLAQVLERVLAPALVSLPASPRWSEAGLIPLGMKVSPSGLWQLLLAPVSIPSANWAGGSGSLALHLQIALWLRNPRYGVRHLPCRRGLVSGRV